MKLTAFKRFNSDLKAALIAGVPIEIGNHNSARGRDRLTIAKLDHLESLLSPGFTNIEPLVPIPDSQTEVIDSHPDIPARYRASWRVFDRTDSMLAVLDGLTMRRLAQQQVNRVLRWTYIYLTLLLTIAFLGLWLFSTQVIPTIELMRDDMLLPAAINASERFDLTPWFPLIVNVLGGSVVLILIFMITGGATKISMWLGGSRFLRFRLTSVALQVTQMLIEAGTPADQAVSISCDLTGADEKVRQDIQQALQAPNGTLSLGTLAEYQTLAGNDRLEYMKVTTPVALVSVIGGGIALLYCLAIFWPIISMLKDLTTAGT